LVSQEYLPQEKTESLESRLGPPEQAEQPVEAPVSIPTIPAKNYRVSLIVFLVAGLTLCAGVLMFFVIGGGDRSTSQGFSSANATGEASNDQLVQASAPALPTFTPVAELLLKFGAQGTGQGEMDDARYIAVDPQGNIFVGDYSGGRVQKFDPQGNFLLLINVPPPDPGSEVYTRGMGVDNQGQLYVARNGEILIYNGADGQLLDTIPSGWPDIYYDSVLVAGDFIYSTNGMAGTDDILKLSPRGEILLHQQEVIERVDRDDPGLNMQLAVDSQGQIYILSNFGPHIYVYDAQGGYLYRFGEEGSGRGQLDLSSDLLAIDPRGRLYVNGSFRIDQFDTLGNYLDYSIDVYDDTDGGVPMGLTFDTQGFLYIICNNGKVLKYQVNSP
jgi:sugar lactone lactonase YvrE